MSLATSRDVRHTPDISAEFRAGSSVEVSAELRERLIGQLTREHGVDLIEADRIVTDTVSFLKVCAANTHKQFRPSRRVDIGWHQFILNTNDYAEFCDRMAGGFIHHVPDEFAGPTAESDAGAAMLAPTVDAITSAGLPFHPELWTTGTGKCSQCHAGCTTCGQ